MMTNDSLRFVPEFPPPDSYGVLGLNEGIEDMIVLDVVTDLTRRDPVTTRMRLKIGERDEMIPVQLELDLLRLSSPLVPNDIRAKRQITIQASPLLFLQHISTNGSRGQSTLSGDDGISGVSSVDFCMPCRTVISGIELGHRAGPSCSIAPRTVHAVPRLSFSQLYQQKQGDPHRSEAAERLRLAREAKVAR